MQIEMSEEVRGLLAGMVWHKILDFEGKVLPAPLYDAAMALDVWHAGWATCGECGLLEYGPDPEEWDDDQGVCPDCMEADVCDEPACPQCGTSDPMEDE